MGILMVFYFFGEMVVGSIREGGKYEVRECWVGEGNFFYKELFCFLYWEVVGI